MMNLTRRPFVLIDRDGTLIVERHYLCEADGVELLGGAVAGLRRLQEQGFGLAVITNQSGIGRGYFTQAAADAVHTRMTELLARQSIRLDGIYCCPHTPADRCACRKPMPGLIHRAAAELGFDPSEAVMIGDKPCDIAAGQAAGATTFLVRTGHGAQAARETFAEARAVRPDYIVDDLDQAAKWIVKSAARAA
jgi:D-glycero-D-manno-heptose 1,7-bisphosphate phosphatase